MYGPPDRWLCPFCGTCALRGKWTHVSCLTPFRKRSDEEKSNRLDNVLQAQATSLSDNDYQQQKVMYAAIGLEAE